MLDLWFKPEGWDEQPAHHGQLSRAQTEARPAVDSDQKLFTYNELINNAGVDRPARRGPEVRQAGEGDKLTSVAEGSRASRRAAAAFSGSGQRRKRDDRAASERSERRVAADPESRHGRRRAVAAGRDDRHAITSRRLARAGRGQALLGTGPTPGAMATSRKFNAHDARARRRARAPQPRSSIPPPARSNSSTTTCARIRSARRGSSICSRCSSCC